MLVIKAAYFPKGEVTSEWQ